LLVVPIFGRFCLLHFSFFFSFTFLAFIAPIKGFSWHVLQCHNVRIISLIFVSTWSCVVAHELPGPFFCCSCSDWILQSEECLRKTVESMRYMAADSKEPLYMVLTGNSGPLSTIYTVAYWKCRRAVEETDLVKSAQLFHEVSPAQNLVRENSHLGYHYLLGSVSKLQKEKNENKEWSRQK
jgi:hypothetical protein